MRKVVAVVALALMAGAGSSQTARAAESSFAGVTMFPPAPGPTVRTATINPRTGAPTSAVTRLQPVIGSVQRTSHFSNPFTHRAKYSGVTYNPVLGTFGTQKFKR